jgi:hypothetical protein
MNDDIVLILSLVIGYAVSIFMGDIVIRPIRNKMHEGNGKEDVHHRWRPRAIGWLERFLYTSSILLCFPEFIAIWLALKVAGQWERWKLDVGKDASKGTNQARATYAVYLVGNGLSVLYGSVGAFIVNQLRRPNWWLAVAVMVALGFLSFLYYLYIKRNAETYSRQKLSKS